MDAVVGLRDFKVRRVQVRVKILPSVFPLGSGFFLKRGWWRTYKTYKSPFLGSSGKWGGGWCACY